LDDAPTDDARVDLQNDGGSEKNDRVKTSEFDGERQQEKVTQPQGTPNTSDQSVRRAGATGVSGGSSSPGPSTSRASSDAESKQNRTPTSSKPSAPEAKGSASKSSGSTGRARSGGIAASVNQARRNQMRSYVASELADTLDSNEAQEAQKARAQLGELGEEEVLRDLEARGFSAKRMPPGNPGYDIEATNTSTGQIVFVEVKGDSFGWSDKDVGITRTQYEKAIEKRGSFYLAVVENLRSHPRRIHYIQDPVAYITEYRFDSGWAPLASDIGQVQRDPTMSVSDELKTYTDIDPLCQDSCTLPLREF